MRWTPDSVSTGPHISPTFRPNAATSKSLRRAIRSNTSGLNSTRRRAGYVPLHLAGTEEAELAALAMRVAVALGARELHEGRLQLGGVAAGLRDDLRLEATRHVSGSGGAERAAHPSRILRASSLERVMLLSFQEAGRRDPLCFTSRWAALTLSDIGCGGGGKRQTELHSVTILH